jgi:hypothetical protein
MFAAQRFSTVADRIGVDIGGSYVKAGLVSPDGAVLSQAEPVPTINGAGVVRDVQALIERMLAESPGVESIGISSCGIVDTHAGLVLESVSVPGYAGTRWTDVLAGTGLPVRVENDARAAAWAEGRLAALGGAPIVVNLGASKPANRWPPERFGELAARLAAACGGPVVFTGGPADVEAGRLAERAAAGAPGVASLVGETDLRQLVALCARARLFVGCDTGPMHVAAAVDTPVVALFGPADARRTRPYGGGAGGVQHRVVRATPEPPCAPCGRKRCNQPRHACMEDITVDAVLDACRATLAAPCGVS